MIAAFHTLRDEARDFIRAVVTAAASVTFGSGTATGVLSLAALCLAPRFAGCAWLGCLSAWVVVTASSSAFKAVRASPPAMRAMCWTASSSMRTFQLP